MSYSKWWNFQFQCKKYEPHPEGQLGLGKLLLCLRGPDPWTPELKLGSKSSLPPGLPGSPRPLPVPPPQGHHSTSLQAQPSLHNRRRSQNLSEGLLIGNQWTITENETKRHCHNWAMMYFWVLSVTTLKGFYYAINIFKILVLCVTATKFPVQKCGDQFYQRHSRAHVHSPVPAF